MRVPPFRFTSAPVTCGTGVGVWVGWALACGEPLAPPLAAGEELAEAGGGVPIAPGLASPPSGVGLAAGELLADADAEAGSVPSMVAINVIGPRVSVPWRKFHCEGSCRLTSQLWSDDLAIGVIVRPCAGC